ncbi:hypothetical protein [Baaleninema sp.]|uniref:hypothetical protein n=1 Tax=Baaleninema sp. TaxID=3101197 RepID=UPI003D013FAD
MKRWLWAGLVPCVLGLSLWSSQSANAGWRVKSMVRGGQAYGYGERTDDAGARHVGIFLFGLGVLGSIAAAASK